MDMGQKREVILASHGHRQINPCLQELILCTSNITKLYFFLQKNLNGKNKIKPIQIRLFNC